MNAKTLKILSVVIAVVGFGLNQVAGIIAKKELDNIVAQKVAEAFAKGAGS